METNKVIPKDLPAGHQRDEAKRVVKDQLEQKIEEQSGDSATFDPSKVSDDAIENEIAQHYDEVNQEFTVVDAQPGYRYLWVRDDYRTVMEVTTRAQRYLGPRVKGYEVVRGDMPECRGMMDSNGYRRLGDCILTRCEAFVVERIEQKLATLNRARELGVSANMLELADRLPQYVRVHEMNEDPRAYFRKRAQGGGMNPDLWEREMIKTLAIKKMAEDARTGRLHGKEIR